jgi:hypothetical protein
MFTDYGLKNRFLHLAKEENAKTREWKSKC